jgi:hypothetical protein
LSAIRSDSSFADQLLGVDIEDESDHLNTIKSDQKKKPKAKQGGIRRTQTQTFNE